MQKFVGTVLMLLLLSSVFSTVFAIGFVLEPAEENEVSEVHTIKEGDIATIQQPNTTGTSPNAHSNPFFNNLPRENPTCWKRNAFPRVDGESVQLVVGLCPKSLQNQAILQNLILKEEGKVVDVVSIKGKTMAVVVEIPSETAASFAAEAQSKRLVKYVEVSVNFEAHFTPNDPYWTMQWGPQKIEADWAWNTTIGSHDVLVAVIDTGVDWNHPDLAANYVPLGYDWVNEDSDPMDDYGHGTHCAGIIAAVINNSVGVAGLAQARIMAEKGLDQWGWGSDYELANAIVHATDQGADVISMSWGGSVSSQVLHDAIEYAYDAGVLLIASAGNEATSMKMYPAAYDEVVAVAATDESDNPAYFSNFGNWIELAAPGVSIFSTVWDDAYTYMSGTSMACPHVAGVAALAFSQFPHVESDWIRLWLRFTADDLGQAGFDERYGYGRVNARKAVATVPPAHELIVSGLNTPPYVEPGATGVVNGTVFNFGSSNETNVEVQLFVNSTMVDLAVISFLASRRTITVSCVWNPTVEGLYNVTFYVVAVPGETNMENNAFAAFVHVGFPLKVVVLDSAGTDLAEVIDTWSVLNLNWDVFGDTMICIDYSTLNKEDISYEDIVASEADVLIISCAFQWEFTDVEIDAIERYVMEGHGLIATAGTFYYLAPNNNKLARLFGMNETIMWTSAETDLLDLENPAHPLFTGVPNPLVFPQTGTALSFDGRWDSNELVEGEYAARGYFKESAIVTFRGLVYLSPWLEILPARYRHHLQLLYNAITWSQYQKLEHELTVSLDAPTYLQPGENALLNATVSNMGLSNETEVELYLTIDDAVVNSTVISEFPAGESCNITYEWTPTLQRIYNITAYAPPLAGEETAINNKATVFTMVSSPLINPEEGQYANYTSYLSRAGEPVVVVGWMDITYLEYVAPYLINVTMTSVTNGYNYTSWIVVSTIDRKVVAPSMPDETYYPYWIETNITIGSEVKLLDTVATVVDSEPVLVENRLVDCWKLSMLYYGYEYSLWVDKASGLMIRLEASVDEYVSGGMLTETNIPIGEVEHDLAVSVEAPDYLAPSTSTVLEATVYNTGLNNETDVELYLSINGMVVAYQLIPELVASDSYSMSYQWSPPRTAVYNITAYAPAKPEESVVANNVASKLTLVRRPLIRPTEGQWANYTIRSFNGSSDQTSWEQKWRFEYGPYVEPWLINTTVIISDNGVNVSQVELLARYWMTINTMDRWVDAGTMWWVDTWYIGWIETDIGLGSTVNAWTDYATVVGERTIEVCGMSVDCWELHADFTYFNATSWYDKESGLLVGWEERINGFGANITLTATNIPVGSAAFVYRCYRDLLFRDPEPEGLEFWVDELESGRLTRAGFVEAALSSEEYRDKWRNRLFVALMYDGVFERTADQGGYECYVDALDSSALTWEQMLDAWLNSTEWNIRFGELNNTEFVTKLYTGMLHRQPDSEGLNYWVNVLENGELSRSELITSFYRCSEYQMVNAERKLVYQLYLGLLRRVPDTEGYHYWVGELHSGTLRETVINAFLTSPEYGMIH